MEGNVNWIPLGILGLIVVIWATKFLTAIRLKQKLKKAWDGAPFFRKKDTEESLIDSLTYPAKGRTIDSSSITPNRALGQKPSIKKCAC